MPAYYGRDSLHPRPSASTASPFNHSRRSWTDNGVQYTVETASYTSPGMSFGATGGTANGLLDVLFPEPRSARHQPSGSGIAAGLLGTALNLLTSANDMRQASNPRIARRSELVESSEADSDDEESGDGLAYGDDGTGSGNRRRRSVFSRVKDKLGKERTRKPPNVRDPYASREWRESESGHRAPGNTRAHGASESEDDSLGHIEYDEYSDMRQRPRSSHANSSQPDALKPFHDAVQNRSDGVRRCRKRLERASRQPGLDIRYIQNLVDQIQLREQALAVAQENLQNEQIRLASGGRPRQQQTPPHFRRASQRQAPQPGLSDFGEYMELPGIESFSTPPRTATHPLFADFGTLHSQGPFADPFFGAFHNHFHHVFGGMPGMENDFHSSFTMPDGTFADGQRKRTRFTPTGHVPQPGFATFTQPPPPMPPSSLLTPDEAKRLFQTYNDRWTALSPNDPNIPYPTRGLLPQALLTRDTLWAPNIAAHPSTWSEETVMQANAQAFFLNVCDLIPLYADATGTGRIDMGYNKLRATPTQIKALIDVLKKEKTRWHSDRLGRRTGGRPGVNEGLQKDVRARAVFHAVFSNRNGRERSMRHFSNESWTPTASPPSDLGFGTFACATRHMLGLARDQRHSCIDPDGWRSLTVTFSRPHALAAAFPLCISYSPPSLNLQAVMDASKDDINRISGPSSMARPEDGSASQTQDPQPSSMSLHNKSAFSTSDAAKPKKKRPRGGKNRRKTRRQSFAGGESESGAGGETEGRPSLLDVPNPRSSAQQSSFYRLRAGNRSNTSLESEALLDHREHGAMRSRRQSLQQPFARPSLAPRHRGSGNSTAQAGVTKTRYPYTAASAISEDDDEGNTNDRTPLLSSSNRNRSKPELARNNSGFNYGSHGSQFRPRRLSTTSYDSSKRKNDARGRQGTTDNVEDGHDPNNPPSVPSSPKLGSLDDVMATDRNNDSDRGRDAIIDIDSADFGPDRRFSEDSPDAVRRRNTMADLAERDVCFPGDAPLSEIGEEEDRHSQIGSGERRKRKRTRQWPELSILEEWAHEEKEERTQQDIIRAKKISEPVMVNGRLRPANPVFKPEEEEQPFRFTYFNEILDSTIHARSISDLVSDGTTFEDLFVPPPIEHEYSEDDEETDEHHDHRTHHASLGNLLNGRLAENQPGRPPSASERSPSNSKSNTGSNTPAAQGDNGTIRPKIHRNESRYGVRPTWWLDVLQPTEMEMKVIARAFGIHQLTVEDILTEEEREKVELFQNYYFVNYRSFEQDAAKESYMEPVNMFIVVFRNGVITFHSSSSPHPNNVRRRIRQLNDYMSPTADWISYAIIDNVTDYFAPRVESIEREVDDIDACILNMHQSSADNAFDQDTKPQKSYSDDPKTQGDMGAMKAEGEKTAGDSGGDMLRRVGECRKRVMGLYRLLGNKADVIKGFAKRCNEQWEVAPKSEIGLYLGDIQDHIVTMTSNLSHYENLLSRAHSNYLAQINIRMNERAEQTSDILGKLTVLGTIVLPMNIITGMWGMNVWVPGQGQEGNLTWFWCITAGLLAFGLTSYFIAKKVYGIV
ncbi:hypothetical protein BAUCODRAFT_25041 [Baudoinia panamericana UAMH 10762]|uniref:Cora-domain-containing protein n=1 Tax=Baudoinia panamericana (strain UAMH 10762) TaxID=717646 RepID=M2MX26_BAUPA|nr:uncharacterized protein BAUCODRAFT_25041 [Baudoinia panamericana UAMH 10762]EMC96098.1 hypothetical protein BAUCODRAFT_25041 [Baudoinia panamericana UAMH 10762]